jgi:hypothetical protein
MGRVRQRSAADVEATLEDLERCRRRIKVPPVYRVYGVSTASLQRLYSGHSAVLLNLYSISIASLQRRYSVATAAL